MRWSLEECRLHGLPESSALRGLLSDEKTLEETHALICLHSIGRQKACRSDSGNMPDRQASIYAVLFLMDAK